MRQDQHEPIRPPMIQHAVMIPSMVVIMLRRQVGA